MLHIFGDRRGHRTGLMVGCQYPDTLWAWCPERSRPKMSDNVVVIKRPVVWLDGLRLPTCSHMIRESSSVSLSCGQDAVR